MQAVEERAAGSRAGRALVLAWGGLGLLWLGVLWGSVNSGYNAGSFDLGANDYRDGCRVGPITIERENELVRVQASAPVENSWVTLEIYWLNGDGKTVHQSKPSLSFYHGVADGQAWQNGQQDWAELAHLPRGEYRLEIRGQAGGGTSSAADFEQFGRPVRLLIWKGVEWSRLLLLLATGAAVIIVAWTLRSLSPSMDCCTSPRARLPGAKRSERFRLLDGLRGLAALAVVFCHLVVPELSAFSSTLVSAIPESLTDLMRRGDLGVEVFFVLSGFVIAYSVRGQQVNPGFTARFAARRALRLDPPYYIALLVSIALWAYYSPLGMAEVMNRIGGVRGLLANLFYLQDLLHYRTPLSIAWTLCLEVQFYLAYIGLLCAAQCLGRFRREVSGGMTAGNANPPSGALLLVFLPLAAWSVTAWFPEGLRFDFLGIWFRFFLGVATYWAFNGQISRWWLGGFIAVLVVLGAAQGDPRVFTAVGTALLIDTAGRLGTLTSWLSASWIQFLGRISYSLYLLHIPLGIGIANILWAMTNKSVIAAVLCASAAVVASLMAAQMLYRYVEAPSVMMSKRMAC
jgi:peptidoglycan/LPS O-acetylase OafA/YrhL